MALEALGTPKRTLHLSKMPKFGKASVVDNTNDQGSIGTADHRVCCNSCIFFFAVNACKKKNRHVG